MRTYRTGAILHKYDAETNEITQHRMIELDEIEYNIILFALPSYHKLIEPERSNLVYSNVPYESIIDKLSLLIPLDISEHYSSLQTSLFNNLSNYLEFIKLLKLKQPISVNFRYLSAYRLRYHTKAVLDMEVNNKVGLNSSATEYIHNTGKYEYTVKVNISPSSWVYSMFD